MFKAYAQKFRKPKPDENDSIDELETLETQDGSVTHKLPESCTMNRNVFLNKTHIESPSKSRAQALGRDSPNPLQVRSQSQEHKGGSYTSGNKQQASQLQGQFNSNLPMTNKENPNRAREYSFNPNGPDFVGTSPYADLANKIFNEKSQDTGANRVTTQLLNTIESNNAYFSKQATFAPNSSSTKNPRNLNQFLEDQNKHLERVEAKKRKIADEQISKEKKEEGTYKPEICQKSVKILEKKKQQEKGPAYQRLYNSSKKALNTTTNNEAPEISGFMTNLAADGEGASAQSLQKKNSKSVNRFKPEIQKKSKIIKREEKVDNLLYNDALRRQNKFSESIINKPKTKSNSVTMSSTSKRAIATRFIKEFDIIVEEFIELGKDQKLNYIQVNELLKKLCFLKGSEQVDHPNFTSERTLIHDSWYILNAERYKGVHRRNLLVFLLAVLNLHFPITKIIKDEKDARESPSDFAPDRSHNPLLTEENDPLSRSLEKSFHPMVPDGYSSRDKRSVGVFDSEGNYEVSEEEVKELHNMFEPWYINRLCAGDNLSQYVSKKGPEVHSFHPEISKASKDLAQNYREKLLAGTAELIQQNKVSMPKDGKISHADLLIVSKKVVEEKINKFGELVKEEQNRDYTFKPQISPYTPMQGEGSQERKSVYARKEKSMTPEPLGKERVYELYALAKLRSEKYDRESEDVEYEKNSEECTFQPNKYLRRETPSKTNTSGYFAKGIERSVERIKNARLEREQQQSASKNTRGDYDGQFVCSMDRTMRNTSKDRTPQRERRSKSPISNARETPMQFRESITSRSHSNAGIANMRRDTYEEHPGLYPYQEEKRQHYEEFNYELAEANQAQRNLAFASEMGRINQGYVEQSQKREPVREITPFMYKDLDSKIDENEDDRVPLLFVDVNLGQGKNERITVFEGDTAEGLAQRFSEEYGLEPLMKSKLKEMLDAQIAGLLSRIEEELHSGYSDTDRHYKHQY